MQKTRDIPTPIFIKKIEGNLEVIYRITSKNNPDIINGRIKIVKNDLS